MLDVAGAAAYLGVRVAFVRRLVLEKRIRYYKVGKFVRFRPADLDAFVEAGRHDPVEIRVHIRSPLERRAALHRVQQAPSQSKARSRLAAERDSERRRDS